MKDKNILRRTARTRRQRRVRKRVVGTLGRPRLSVYRSLKNIQGQLVDDLSGRSILGLSSLSVEVREQIKDLPGKCAESRAVGRMLAEKAKKMGIAKVVFDRGGYLYHGRVKAFAEGAREGGLVF